MVAGIDIELVFKLHDWLVKDLQKRRKGGWWYSTTILSEELKRSTQVIGHSMSWMAKQTCSHYEGKHRRKIRVEQWSKSKGSTKWRVDLI